MSAKKTLQDRERELQTLLATPTGRAEIQALAERYHAETGKVRAAKTSVITYILVHERQYGLIAS